MISKVIYAVLTVFIGSLDEAEKKGFVNLNSVGSDSLDKVSSEKANALTEIIKALFWESACCAMPDISKAHVRIELESIEYMGYYQADILPENTSYEKWTPEMSTAVEEAAGQIKKDLAALLSDMANGCPTSEEWDKSRYVIRRR